MGQTQRLAILYSDSVTIFGRVVRVYGEEPVTGLFADGATRSEVAAKLHRMVRDYLTESTSACRTGRLMGTSDTEIRAVTAAITLMMRAHALYPEDEGGPAVILLRSDLTVPPLPDERRRQLADREALHDYLLHHDWVRIERTVRLATTHGWSLSVLASPQGVNAVVTHNGVPWLYSGPLFTELDEDARVWLSRVLAHGHVELLYLTDHGKMPTTVEEYERLLAQQRAYVIAVPVVIEPGTG